jgi:hypothetical protein
MMTSPRRRESRSEWVLPQQAFEEANNYINILSVMLSCSDSFIIKCLDYPLYLVNLEVGLFIMWMLYLIPWIYIRGFNLQYSEMFWYL